jgi:hypothetical protein
MTAQLPVVRRSEPGCTSSNTRGEHAMTTVRRQTGVGSLAGLHPLSCGSGLPPCACFKDLGAAGSRKNARPPRRYRAAIAYAMVDREFRSQRLLGWAAATLSRMPVCMNLPLSHISSVCQRHWFG